jgi:23S rRNA pseudouridine1911/1915/1917 synthase
MIQLLYRDDVVIVVDKPAGVASTPHPRRSTITIHDMLRSQIPDVACDETLPDGGAVHRLDTDTSGCLIIARTPAIYTALRAQFAQRCVKKIYTALVVGQPPLQGATDVPIDHAGSKRMRCGSDATQAAHTEWEVLTSYPMSSAGAGGLALLHIQISTGVRHQIRAHMAYLGYPLVGDRLYQNKQQRHCDRLGLSHHLLHASEITFTHPETGVCISCRAPLPAPFATVLKRLDEMKDHR